MKKPKNKKYQNISYTEAVELGYELFPEDTYYVRKMTFGKIKYK